MSKSRRHLAGVKQAYSCHYVWQLLLFEGRCVVKWKSGLSSWKQHSRQSIHLYLSSSAAAFRFLILRFALVPSWLCLSRIFALEPLYSTQLNSED